MESHPAPQFNEGEVYDEIETDARQYGPGFGPAAPVARRQVGATHAERGG
jgi:hypothetical protein